MLCLSAQSCLTLCDPLDCNLPGPSVHGISQARILELVAIFFSRDLPDPAVKPAPPASPPSGDSFLLLPPGELIVSVVRIVRC